ncbi:MAG: amylo-alpha-1,6-glucosidase, partial [Tenuifilaceae bacterium]
EEDMNQHGICSISEIYDGDPPQRPRGAISQAWSVAEILRIKRLYEMNT